MNKNIKVGIMDLAFNEILDLRPKTTPRLGFYRNDDKDHEIRL